MTATIAVRLTALQKMLVQSIRIRVVIRNVSKGQAAICARHGPVCLAHDRGLVPPRLVGRAAIAIAAVGGVILTHVVPQRNAPRTPPRGQGRTPPPP
jgi:hypothetical protein